jgi:MFS family permease
MQPIEKRIVWLTSLSHCLVHIDTLIFPAIMPMLIAEFESNYFSVGLAGNAGYLLFGLGALPAGILTDRFGARKFLAVYSLGILVSSLVIYHSRSLPGFAFGLALLGLFASIHHPAGLSLISKSVKEQGRGLGIHGVAGNIGLALAPTLASAIGMWAGWRFSYVLLTLPALFLFFAFFRLPVTESPRSHFTLTVPDEAADWLPLLLLYLSAALNGLCYYGVWTFLPTYLGERTNLQGIGIGKIASGGFLTTTALLIGIAGQYMGGRLSDKTSPEKVFFTGVLFSLPFLISMMTLSGLALVGAASGFSFFHFYAQPAGNYLLARLSPERLRGAGYGIFHLLGFGVGSFAAPVSGYIADSYGLNSIFSFVSLTVILNCLVCAYLYRQVRAVTLPISSMS